MTLDQRRTRARALAGKPSRADRLAAVLKKINPKATSTRDGWKLSIPPPWADPNNPADAGVAPYLIRELDDGNVQIQVMGTDGDVISGLGKTVEDALGRVEEKVQ